MVGLVGVAALGLEDAAQLALHELHALDPRVVGLGRHALERTVEVVEDGQQLADEQRVAELPDGGALLVGAALEVREVGGGALPVVQVLLALRARIGQLALELLDALRQLQPGWGLDRSARSSPRVFVGFGPPLVG